jgi:small subunit ribosomal protein S16
MVIVRLYRTGARNKPSYRIVAMDSRKKRQGRVLEQLGTYDPRGEAFEIREASLAKWIENGAALSDSVASLVKRQKRLPATASAS